MSIAYFILAAAAAGTADDLAVRAVHEFGACIVSETPRGAREVLALDYRTDDYRKRLRRLAKGHGRCVVPGWSLGASSVLVAGAMAEAMLESRVRADKLPERLAYHPAREPIAARSPTETMALCAVLNAPQASARLLATGPATKEEIEAMKPFGPVLRECLAKDVKLTTNKPMLRSLLALAAWRIATAPTAVTTSSREAAK